MITYRNKHFPIALKKHEDNVMDKLYPNIYLKPHGTNKNTETGMMRAETIPLFWNNLCRQFIKSMLFILVEPIL